MIKYLVKTCKIKLVWQMIFNNVYFSAQRLFDDLWPKTDPYTVPSLQGSDLRLSIMGLVRPGTFTFMKC